MPETTPMSPPNLSESNTSANSGVSQEATKPAPKKRGPNKPKASVSKKLLVKTVYGHAIFAHTQKMRIEPSTIVEVSDDSWIRRQIKLGTLKEV